MKKIVLLFVISVLFVVGCGMKEASISKDEVKFKEEYEKFNGKKQGEHEIMSISIDDNNRMKYIDSEEVIEILEGKTGVIYFGFPNCPWCRNAVPVLIEAAKDSDLERIYYANLLEERDQKKLEDGSIIIEKEGSKEYQKILSLLDSHLGVYEGLEDDRVKRLYFPTVLFVKNGKVEDIHIGTLDSQEDPYQSLTEKQYGKLKEIYQKGIHKIQSLTCDTDKTC